MCNGRLNNTINYKIRHYKINGRVNNTINYKIRHSKIDHTDLKVKSSFLQDHIFSPNLRIRILFCGS